MRPGNWTSTPQQLTMGLPQAPPPPLPPTLSPVLSNIYTNGLNSNGLSRVRTLVDGALIYKTANDIHTVVTAVPEQLQKSVTLVPRDRVQNQSKQGVSPMVHLQQQSSRASNASSLLQWRSHRTHEQPQIPRDPLQQKVDIQDAGRINKTQVEERTVRAERHGF